VESAASFAKNCYVEHEKDFNNHHRRRCKPKEIDENPETAAEIVFSQFYCKELKIFLDVFRSTGQQALSKYGYIITTFSRNLSYTDR